MFKLSLAAFVVMLLTPPTVLAHHKPGHNPPGHQKQQQVIEWEVEVMPSAAAIDPLMGWSLYEDAEFGFAIELPMDLFEQVDGAPRGIRLREVDGDGQLDIYGGVNSARLEPAEIAAELEGNPQIGEVTYRAGGRNWIVLSGYYSRDDYAGDDLIFYAKFMFNADRSRLSAFEISYPEGDRDLFDPIVERLEDTLTPPM